MAARYFVGDVLEFRYVQPYGGDQARYGRIVDIRRFDKYQLEKLNCRSIYRLWEMLNGEWNRDFALLTVEHVDGSFRRYYHCAMIAKRKYRYCRWFHRWRFSLKQQLWRWGLNPIQHAISG